MDKDFILTQIAIINREIESGKFDNEKLLEHIVKRLDRIEKELNENS